MKTLLRFVVAALSLFASMNPLYAQWVQANGTNGPIGATVRSFYVSGNNLFAGTTRGVFLSTDNGASWSALNTAISPYAFAASGANLFAGTTTGVFLSTDNGTNWTAVNNGLTTSLARTVRGLAVSGSSIFAGTYDDVYLSSNNGTSWTSPSSILTGNNISSLALNGTNLFAGCPVTSASTGGIWLSTNNGTSWTAVNTGLTNRSISALALSGTRVFAGTNGGGICYSTNNGASWTAANNGLVSTVVLAIALSGTNLFAGTAYDAAGGGGYGVYLSNNNGATWTAVNSGFTSTMTVNSIAFCGSYVFAGTQGYGVWRRPSSEMVTSVERLSTDVPTRFSLEQNYPNPFNPSTKIQFSIPNTSFISLEVFNVLGAEIATLMNESKAPGTYQVAWDAHGYPSGVYLYRLIAGGRVFSGKMNLLK